MESLDGLIYFLALAGFCAGFVDAVVGGGGLIQVPALFGSLPQASTASLHGTNKLSSACGTAFAAWRYARSVRLDWRVLLPAVAAAAAFAWLGANLVSLIPRVWAQPLVLVLLVGVALLTLRRPSMGLVHAPRLTPAGALASSLAVGAGIGFYDGFFGPGTGAFLMFIFVRWFGYDFLHASAAAKLVNLTTNLAALTFFLPSGAVIWQAGLVMGACNVLGSFIGTRAAVRKGSGFVRIFFLVVLAVMIARLGWTTLEVFERAFSSGSLPG